MTERQKPPPAPEARRKTNIERERGRQLSGEHPTVGTANFDVFQAVRGHLPAARPAKDFSAELKAKAEQHQPMKHFQTPAEIRASMGKTEKPARDSQTRLNDRSRSR